MTHFVQYIGKEKYDIVEILLIERVLKFEITRKFATKASPRPFFNFGK